MIGVIIDLLVVRAITPSKGAADFIAKVKASAPRQILLAVLWSAPLWIYLVLFVEHAQ